MFVSILSLACILLTLAYAMLMLAYTAGWRRQKDFVLPTDYVPSGFISVVVPARNEEKKIGACLESVMAQQYPADKFEIIVVDDHSDDETAAVVKEYVGLNVHYVNLADHVQSTEKINAYKKRAIAAGIAKSVGDLIVTIDADCTAPNAWLMHIAAAFESSSADMVVAPVIYSSNYSWFQLFQLTDVMSMQGITAASHALNLGNMGNGGNLAFRKEAFLEVDGYAGTEHLASGDDYLLMTKMKKLEKGNVRYIKTVNAVVATSPEPDWQSFVRQRIRWASKSGKYDDKRLTATLALVYLFNLCFPILLIAGMSDVSWFYWLGAMFVIKTLVELIFLWPVANFFRNRWVLRYFPVFQPFHIAYVVVVGFLGVRGGYTWKGRKVR